MRLIMTCLLLTAAWAYAAEETITGSYCYTYGDNETLLEARQLTRSLALRNAIESHHIFVEAAAVIENFTLSADVVQTLTGSYIRNVRVVEQSEIDRKICMTVSGIIDPDAFETVLRNQVMRRIRAAQQLGIDNNGALKVLSTSPVKFNDKGDKVVEAVVKVLEHTGRLDSAVYRNDKPQFKICITYYDRSGAEISGDAVYIHTNADGLSAGEIRTVAFRDPPIGAVAWRVWLVK